jgi:hypothetical protein
MKLSKKRRIQLSTMFGSPSSRFLSFLLLFWECWFGVGRVTFEQKV